MPRGERIARSKKTEPCLKLKYSEEAGENQRIESHVPRLENNKHPQPTNKRHHRRVKPQALANRQIVGRRACVLKALHDELPPDQAHGHQVESRWVAHCSAIVDSFPGWPRNPKKGSLDSRWISSSTSTQNILMLLLTMFETNIAYLSWTRNTKQHKKKRIYEVFLHNELRSLPNVKVPSKRVFWLICSFLKGTLRV